MRISDPSRTQIKLSTVRTASGTMSWSIAGITIRAIGYAISTTVRAASAHVLAERWRSRASTLADQNWQNSTSTGRMRYVLFAIGHRFPPAETSLFKLPAEIILLNSSLLTFVYQRASCVS